MSAALQAWLATPTSFAAGVALYQQLGGSAVYSQLFATGETSYSRQVLVRELTKMAAALATMATALPPVQVPITATPAPPEAAPAAPASPSESPSTHTDSPHLKPVRDKLRQLRDERSHLHAQLSAPRLTLKDRGKHALRILDIGDQVLALQMVEAHVLAHGTLPAGPVALADIQDEGELRQRLNNLVAKRSKVRKNPKRAEELPTLEADIELIRQKLTPH